MPTFKFGTVPLFLVNNFINENSMIIYNGKEMKVSEVASLPRFNISGEEFARIYNENRLNNEEIEQEEIYDKIEDEVNDDLGMPQERRYNDSYRIKK